MPVGSLTGHADGIRALFGWLSQSWDDVYQRFPPSGLMLGTLVSSATSRFTTTEQLEEVERFFSDKDKTGYERSLEQSKDAVRSRMAWVERDSAAVSSWLQENGYLS